MPFEKVKNFKATVDKDCVKCIMLEEPTYLSKVEKKLLASGDTETYPELRAALHDFEFKLCANVYLQSMKDQQEIQSLDII